MTPVQIRDARPADRDAILDTTLAAYAEYAPHMPLHWDGYRANILATLADPAPAEQIVAEQDGAVVGGVLLYPAGLRLPGTARARSEAPEVRLLAVAPAARGHGVGRALMQECIRRARSRSASLTLHTTPMMRAAVRLYERLGFARAPELDVQVAPDLTIAGYRLAL